MYTEEVDEEAERDESETESVEEIEQSFEENNTLIRSVIYEIETEWC